MRQPLGASSVVHGTVFLLWLSLLPVGAGPAWGGANSLTISGTAVAVHDERQPCPQRPHRVLDRQGEQGTGTAYLWLVNHCDALKPPTNLQATQQSSTSVGLTWTAPNGSAVVDHYEIWRTLSGTSTLLGTATSLTYTDATASTALIPLYEYRVRAADATNHVGSYSNIAIADDSAPSAPSNSTATTAGVSQINLSWGASTDNGYVAGYKIERCQGASCSTFTEVATVGSGVTTYNNTGLSQATSYTYRVRAVDGAGNLSAYSSNAAAATATYLLSISNAGVLSVSYGGVGDEMFYLLSPNSTSWKVVASGTTGTMTITDGLTGSPTGRALTSPNGTIWDFSVTDAGIVKVTERQ